MIVVEPVVAVAVVNRPAVGPPVKEVSFKPPLLVKGAHESSPEPQEETKAGDKIGVLAVTLPVCICRSSAALSLKSTTPLRKVATSFTASPKIAEEVAGDDAACFKNP